MGRGIPSEGLQTPIKVTLSECGKQMTFHTVTAKLLCAYLMVMLFTELTYLATQSK